MENLSSLKYKRHCSIFKNDLEKNDKKTEQVLSQSSIKETGKTKLNGKMNGFNNNTTEATTHWRKKEGKKLMKNYKNIETGPDEGVFDKDIKDFRLDVLKEVFKDSYSDNDMLDAVGNCDSLQQAVSILLDSPMKSNRDSHQDCDLQTGIGIYTNML